MFEYFSKNISSGIHPNLLFTVWSSHNIYCQHFQELQVKFAICLFHVIWFLARKRDYYRVVKLFFFNHLTSSPNCTLAVVKWSNINYMMCYWITPNNSTFSVQWIVQNNTIVNIQALQHLIVPPYSTSARILNIFEKWWFLYVQGLSIILSNFNDVHNMSPCFQKIKIYKKAR